MSRNFQEQASVRPVTLHINTGRGTAVVQVQTALANTGQGPCVTSSAGARPSSNQRLSVPPPQRQLSAHNVAGAFAATSSPIGFGCPMMSSSSSLLSVGGSMTSSTASSRIFPTSIILPSSAPVPTAPSSAAAANLAAAAAASAVFGGYFYPPPTVDHVGGAAAYLALQQAVAAQQQQHTAAALKQPSTSMFGSAAAKYLSPAGSNFAAELHQHLHNAAHQNRFSVGLPPSARLPTSPLSHGSVYHGLGGSPTSSSLYHYGPQSGAPMPPGSAASGQSPRPSILRKRPIDPTTAVAVAASLSSSSTSCPSSSAASKRLTYDTPLTLTPAPLAALSRPPPHVLSTIVRRLADMGPLAPYVDDGISGRVPAIVSAVATTGDSTDAGNSNHSSTASTASAGSSLNDVSSTAVAAASSSVVVGGEVSSPSPRKRQRKQRLDDLPRDYLPSAPPSLPSAAAAGFFLPSTTGAFGVGQSVRSAAAPRSSPAAANSFLAYGQSSTNWQTIDQTETRFLSAADQSTLKFQPISLPNNICDDKTFAGRTNRAELMEDGDKSTNADSSPRSTPTSSSSSSDPYAPHRPTLLSSDAVVYLGANDTSLSSWSHWRPRRNHFRRRDDVRDVKTPRQTSTAATTATMSSSSSSQKMATLTSSTSASTVTSSQQRKMAPTASIHEMCQPSRHVGERVDAWRLHLVGENLRELFGCQRDNLEELDVLLGALVGEKGDENGDGRPMEGTRTLERADESWMVKEAILTSRQRCLAIRERLLDARGPFGRILQHRTNADDLVLKYATKRTIRKKVKPG